MTNQIDVFTDAINARSAHNAAGFGAIRQLKSVMDELGLSENHGELLEAGAKLGELMLVCNSAIKEVRTRLDILNDELTIRHRKNTIESISSRVKTMTSVIGKLKQRGHPLTLDSIKDNIDDIAGVRVICAFSDDIYDVADMLLRQDDIILINRKDYIKSPKPNGYRSLHLLVEVPVFFSDDKQMVKVEIQIRTIAMDFWASLEHQLRYKKRIDHFSEIEAELLECSRIIADVDRRMLDIRDMIAETE